LAGLHGVSGSVPFVFTEFDWKDAATKLNLATVKRRRQPPPTAAWRFQNVNAFIVTVLSSGLSQPQRRCGFRFVRMVKAKRL
jgi:hypothetical protein